jgi:hypothetical protein
MKSDEFNNLLRQLFKDLIDQGYKKYPMVEVTLGKTFSPQFSKFIEESDLGLTPLERMIKGLGFELHLIPVKTDDTDFYEKMNEKYLEFTDTSKNDLIDYLDNRTIKTGGKSPMNQDMFNNVLDDLLNELEKEE